MPVRWLLPLALWLGSAALSRVHDPGLSAADVRLEGDHLSAHLSFNRVDIERLVVIDANGDGWVARAELDAARPRLEQLAREALAVVEDGRAIAAKRAAVSLDSNKTVHFYLGYPRIGAGTLSVRAMVLERLPRGHREYLSVRNGDGDLLVDRMLDASTGAVALPRAGNVGSGPAPPSFRQFLALGIGHILTGYDHLLFLFGLLLPGFSLRRALTIITAFTVAHSITLTLATLDLVRVPSGVVEPLIALSIVYVGVENLFRADPTHRWLLTFGFGLVHGFGFATALRDLGIGSGGGAIAVPLFSFNAGVEVGQLAIAALVLPLMWKLRQHPELARRAVPVGSLLVSLAGSYWLIRRTLLL